MPANTLKGFPLSLQQARLYAAGNIQMYRVLCRVLLEGSLCPDVLQKSLRSIIGRYSILRTRFYCPPGMDVPMQVVSSQAEMAYEEFDLSSLDVEQQATRIALLFTQLKECLIDPESGPPVHVMLLRTGTRTHQLLFCLPALCADVVTLKLILLELGRVYQADLHGEVVEHELPLQYTDVSAWQDELLQEEDEAGSLSYWDQVDLTRLSTQPLPFHSGRNQSSKRDLPVEAPDVLQQYNLLLSADMMRQLQQFSQPSALPLEAVFLTIWQIALQRLTDEPELLIGVTCDGRNYEELETTPGCCARITPLVTHFNRERSFAQNVLSMNALLAQVREQQMYFAWRGKESLAEDQFLFFPLAFEYMNWPETWKMDTLSLSCIEEYSYLERSTLKLKVVQTGHSCRLELHYAPAFFTDRQIERLADTVEALLSSALARPSDPVGSLDLMSNATRHHLLGQWRGPGETSGYQPLTRLFEKNVCLMPSAPAVICSGQSLTYEQLNQRANRLAHRLQKLLVGPDVLVGLYAERGIDMLVGVLGILKAGGAYVPLDPAFPTARLEQQLTQSELPVLLTQAHLLEQLPTFAGQVLCLDRDSGLLDTEVETNPEIVIGPEQLAYVIYTSGSTGSPKEVAIRQQSVSNYVQDMCRRVAPGSGLRFATVSTLAADLGNTAIFCSLASGGCLHILPYAVVTSSEAFARYIDEHPIDVLKIVPSHLSALLAHKQGKRILPQKYLILGGEVLPWSLIEQLQAIGCACKVLNHYGPTETTIGVLVNELETFATGEKELASVPLGVPISNTHFVIVDQNGVPVPVEVPGELWIGGAGLAVGYLGNPELTDQRFVLSTFLPASERFYRTGDRVRSTEQGQIEFLGRIDRQIKLWGYRIEPGDIEAILKQHTLVRESIVLLQEDTPGEPKLVAYVLIARNHAQAMSEGTELRRFLSDKLPAYMLPSVVMPLSEWPLTVNGKIDYQQLKTLNLQSLERTVIAPRDHSELKLARIWENLLHVWPLSITDNFFDLGGHSILAVALIAQIQNLFGYDLPVTALFQYPTIEKLASVLRHSLAPDQWQTIVPMQTGGSKPPLFCVHTVSGTAFCYYNLAHCLGPEQPVYGIQAANPETWDQTALTVVGLSAQYIEALREIQPQGPYFLGGWSAGGVIAFEMARQLRERGEEVALLALFDSSAPVAPTAPLPMPDLRDHVLARSIFEELQLASSAQPLDSLPSEERLIYVLEQAKIHNHVPQDITLVQFQRFARMQKMLLYALRNYNPAVYAGCITLFRVQASVAIERERVPPQVDAASSTPVDRWAKFSSEELELHIVPGEHATLMNEPDVSALAATLSRCLTWAAVERG